MFCLVLEKAIVLDGFVTKVIGPFETINKAMQYGDYHEKDLKDCGEIVIETMLIPKDK